MQKIIQSQNIFPTIFFLLFPLIFISEQKCTDRPQCFKKLVFNFNFPQMNLFEIKATSDFENNFQMKAYGDFNNDLYTDFVSVNGKDVMVFAWSGDQKIYEKVFTFHMVEGFQVKNIYLADISGDGKMDIAIWGKTASPSQKQNAEQNILALYTRQTDQEYNFTLNVQLKMPLTSNPIMFGHKFKAQADSVGFLIFKNSERVFLKYRHQENMDPIMQQVGWNELTENGHQVRNKGFRDPHWGAFLDITGDCLPELALINEHGDIQIWISHGKKFQLSPRKQKVDEQLKGMTFAQINYDGSVDLVLFYQRHFQIYLNTKSLTPSDQFCCPYCKSFQFQQTPIIVSVPSQKSIKQQSIHFADINIDGYPDILLILVNDDDKKQFPTLFENKFDESLNTFKLFESPNYNSVLAAMFQNQQNILSVSFIDILQNGILDIVVTSLVDSKLQTRMFYNNFLCQNDFFIKGYGLLGPTVQQGSQFPGISFYWINSVKNGFKVTYQPQMIQTAYDALQMPYAYCGLGRANNYVQRFTVGRNGNPQEWQPIIPNSQLGVFTTNQQQDKWKIRIFSFPFYELIAVIIVTAVVLAIFGVFLMYKKCLNYGKKQEPLQIQFIS